MRISHAAASANPPPTAGPLTAAITGCGNPTIFGTNDAMNSWVRMPAAAPVRSRAVGATAGSDKSRPEQKPRPAPVRITTRQRESAARSSSVVCWADTIAVLSASSRSGLLSVTTARPDLGRSNRTAGTTAVIQDRAGMAQADEKPDGVVRFVGSDRFVDCARHSDVG